MALSVAGLSLAQSVTSVLAQIEPIKNPVISEDLGADAAGARSGAVFGSFFITLWNAAISIGGITVLVLFIIAGYEWLGAGSDKGKLEKARNRITHAIIGLVILVSSHLLIGFISSIVFGETFDILNPFGNFTAPGTSTTP